ncbi:MAG TPA: hypothetical protein VLA24_16500 [Pseudomonadales bacterium]|nr:hypothetical protein [Pseudomonadales bacterium]
MGEVLPDALGLTVSAVSYGYTIGKPVEADALVHLYNEDATGSGYIFRETDDWSGLAGNTIRKNVAVANIPIWFWGDGGIEVEGEGEITNASVIYAYRIDECFDPQSNPLCPDYVPPVDYQPTATDFAVYDATNDDAVRLATQETDKELYEEDKVKAADEDEEEDERRMERALAASTNALAFETGIAQDQVLAAMQNPAIMAAYQRPEIKGGVYPDAAQLNGGFIPDSRSGLRNGLAQQLLHEEMVASQYR